jgi:phosphatidate cytidylyltransferase
MLITRLLSGIVLLAIVISTGILGGPVFWALVTLISLLGIFEFHRMLGLQKSALFHLNWILCLGLDALLFFGKTELADLMPVVALLVLMGLYVVRYPKYEVKEAFASYLGFVYVAVLLSFLYRIRLEENGMLLLWLVYIGTWGSDTCAYCIGCLFGKHKAFPVLSPKKSVEGCIGGVVGTALIAGIYAVCLNHFVEGAEVSVLAFVVIGILASVVSQIGDLAASALKRNYEIKDYGKLIPGHGGILDRFDSIMFTAPLVYLMVQVLAL